MHRDELLAAAGSLREAYAAVDWAATPVGPVEAWSPALVHAVELALQTRFPVTLFWGPEFALVYNAAYVELIADKHPAALGSPAERVFPEVWGTIGPMMRSVRAGGGANWVEDEHVPLARRGRLEEAYFTFSYSPVRGADGAIEGVMDIATETTRTVIDRRRLVMLNRLREQVGGAEREEDVLARALPLLRGNAADLPDVRLEESDDPLATDGVRDGVARLPIGVRPVAGRPQPVLRVRLSEHVAPDAAYLGFLRLIASLLGQALDRATARSAERGVAESLQRAMLTRPHAPGDLEVGVRYRPAAALNQIGGDWYDAFVGSHGWLKLVVGDVAGHDQHAAAAMAQLRNLMRGISFTLGQPPSRVLAAVDDAMRGLALDAYATAILAQVERDAAGARRLCWSNAGHPPPALVDPSGRARLLHSPPDVLLGLDGGRERHDHVAALPPGSTVVLYTDGLVERRQIPLDDRLDWLLGLLEGGHERSPDELCDRLLAALDESVEDDVALLVMRVLPE